MARLLILDQDAASQDILAKILTEAGHEVVLASDGGDAVTLYEERRFDVVFSDIFLPGKEGLEAIRELREKDPGVRIIAVTGGSALSSELALNRARELGVLCTIRKPYRVGEVLRLLHEILTTV